MSTTLDEAISAVMTEVAMGLARKDNLICENGQIVCRECRDRLALMPSLHCGGCLGAAYSRMHIVNPQCVNVGQNVRTVSVQADRKGSA